MKQKVGILTYHFAINYGAILQCYALQRKIGELGIEVCTLNLITDKQKKNNDIISPFISAKAIFKNIALLPFYNYRNIKKKKFREFANKYLNLSDYCCDEQTLIDVLSKNAFTDVVCGSDQVWNTYIEDFTPLFFLPFSAKICKIGYGISVGNSGFYELKPFTKEIDSFEKIGVREKSTITLLNSLGINSTKLTHVVDPCLLLTKNEWSNIASENNNSNYKKPFILCYFINKDFFGKEKFIVDYFEKKYNYPVYYINQRYGIHCFRKNTLFKVGVEEFLNLFKRASLILTDSFHGTIFSIIFNKQFYSICNSRSSKERRKQDLLSLFDLNNRAIYLDEDFIKVDDTIDYTIINKEIDKYRKASVSFLEQALEKNR